MRGIYVLLFFVLVRYSSTKKVRWCTVSDPEQRKCAEMAKSLLAVLPPATTTTIARLSCICASSTTDCINKVRANRADIVTLDAGEVYSAIKHFGLLVVAKEIYNDGGCVLSVAVVRNSSLDIRSLQGLRSCHSGLRWTAGWSLPLGFLLSRNYMSWSKERPLAQDVGSFFNASCVPGSAAMAPHLCALCQGQRSYIRQKNYHCETSHSEPFYNSQGALRCLKSGAGDVAFVDHLALESIGSGETDTLRLLCTNGTQAPISRYNTCHLGRGPGAGVVTRFSFRNMARKFLLTLQMLFGRQGRERHLFQLFDSSPFGESDLLFKDATSKLAAIPDGVDISQVLGQDYVALLKGLGHEGSSLEDSVVRWCCISHTEEKKCEQWALSIESDPLVCVRAVSMRDCVEKIKRDEVDAVSLDATHVFFAEKCGLVPVVTEYYGRQCNRSTHLERDGKTKGLTSTGWAQGWTSSDFELLCADGRRASLSEWESCNLGVIPPNTIVTRPVHTERVHDFLMKSQETLAATTNSQFKLFESHLYGESDLLFKDATRSFVQTSHMDYRSILGEEFYNRVEAAFNCTQSADILKLCSQDMCATV
ncbi:saxiphilin-like isoform X4 [Dunckerocampus dactyliophorus]|uniref:saxiphilin-like isoform X4 n=1 Tax=Dunckerocampus dactyliophorus TaxID=161453 RepID=UPI002405099A|nr:saxiphilin-like isoform X4 [Dunckerocampus dactyliophorus]